MCCALVVQPTLVYALPTGGTVVGGDASIVAGDSSLTVNQTTQRALINWTGFDIGGAESVQFNQPGASSITLNRVNSASASQINGSLSSNGQVWIVNQNGVMFGQGAQVNVGGLLATTANISDSNFMNGNYVFDVAGNHAASIVNDGSITVADAGFAALVAPVVRNNGVIQAKLGTVNLSSGDTFAVDLYGDGLINLEASAALQQQLISNSGLIEANGGSVFLTAAAAGDMVDSLINMDGIIRANSIGEKNGSIVLYAEGSNAVAGNVAADKGQKQGISTVLVSGTIEAKGNAAGEHGGNVDVLGDHVGLMSGASLDASGMNGGGKIRIGGDYFGGGDTPTALKTLVQRNTTIKANAIESGDGGRITLWSDDTTWFGGAIEAKGGAFSGNGGFVEVSGKEYLTFRGTVDTRAENGATGLLLLDPADIVIADGTADSAADGSNTFSGDPSGTVGTILSGDTGPATIYESELEGIAASTNISLASTNSITINNLTDNNLNLAQTGGNSVTFTTGAGGFNMNSGDAITTAGGAINIVTTGGTSTIGSLAAGGGLITLNMGGTITVSGVISGTGTGLTKTGSGTLALNNANTYDGTTTLTAGTIAVGNNSALGTGTLSLNGGTLQGDGTARTLANNITLSANSTIGGSSALQFDGTFGNLSGNRTLTVSNSANTTFDDINISSSATDRELFIDGAGNMIVNGVIANGGGSSGSVLTHLGSGMLALNGANTFGRYSQFNNGITQIGNDSALGSGSVWLAGGTWRGDGTTRTISNNLSLFDSITIAGSSDLVFNGNLNSGDLSITNNNSGLTTFANINLSDGATDRTLTITGTGNTVISGVIANGSTSTASGITKAGSGTLTLDGSNTYGGITTLTAGTIEVGHNNALGTGALSLNGGTLRGDGTARTLTNNVTLAADSTIGGSSALQFDGTLGNITGTRYLDVSNSATTTFGNINVSSDATDRFMFFTGTGNTVVNGVVANGGGSASSGIGLVSSGSLTLNGNNTYGGNFYHDGGTLILGHDNALGTANFLAYGGTIQGTGGTRTIANNISYWDDTTFAGSVALVFNGDFYNTNNLSVTNNNTATTTFSNIDLAYDATNFTLTFGGTGNTVVGGVISNGGGGSTTSAITKTGSGTLTLDGNNTYGGTTTLTAGTIEVGHNNALGTGTLSLNGGTLRGDGTARTLANNITLDENSTIAGSSALQFDGTFGNLSADRTITVNNSATTTFDDINISSSATNRTLTIAGTGNTVISGVIANGSTSTASGITKSGAGILTLSGNNTYAGDTNINGGTLRLGAANRLANTTDVVIGASGTFDLNGYSETVASITNGGAITMGTGNTLTTTGAQTHTGSISGTDISIIANTGNLTFDTVSTNTLFAQAVAGDIILNDQITAAANAGTSITLVADDQFINNHGATALQTAGTARWLVYSDDSANNTRGSLTGFNRYGCTYNAGSPDCAVGTSTPATGNGFYFNFAPTLTISGLSAANKVYDGNTTATITGTATLNGIINSDTVTLDASGATATFDNRNVGNGKTVTFSGYGFATNLGYLLTQPSTVVANIMAKALTIAGLAAANKVYDGTTAAALSGTGSLVGVVGGDTVGFTMGTATFDTPNVGTNKTVTGSGFGLSGADLGNYLLTQPSWFADITSGSVVANSNQNTINAIVSQLGLLIEIASAVTSVSSTANIFEYAPGIPEPSRMDISAVEEAPQQKTSQDKPVAAKKKDEAWIEINALIDFGGLLKGAATEMQAAPPSDEAVAPTKPAVKHSDERNQCGGLMGSAVCASKIFSTIGVPNI